MPTKSLASLSVSAMLLFTVVTLASAQNSTLSQRTKDFA